MTKKGTLRFVPKSTPPAPEAKRGLLQFTKTEKVIVPPQRKTKGSRYA